MSHTIAYVIYGYDLTHLLPKLVEKWDEIKKAADVFEENPKQFLQELLDFEYFQYAYSANGDKPIWIGPTLDTFNDCEPLKFHTIRCRPTLNQQDQVKAELDRLPEWLKKTG